ncbi:MAG: metallophosphoesterase family protein [Firmicutes bacterium]|nr:metallophosphoesterase family protein [Bacillota bacterium]
MGKMAVIADIHGNLGALEAVLEDASSAGVQTFICCGDLVDYGPDPNEAVDRIKAAKIPCVLGNHDRAVGESFPLEDHRTAPGRDRSVELACLKWTRERCTEATKAFLRALPPTLSIERQGLKILVVHATPASVDDYLWPEDGEGWRELHRATVGYDLALLGHTHLPLVRTMGDAAAGNTLYLNPGSVGKPRGGDPRANYAVVEFTGVKFTVLQSGSVAAGTAPINTAHAARPEVEFRKVAYDAERTAARMQRYGLPQSTVKAIRNGSFT